MRVNIKRATALNLSLLIPYASKPMSDVPPLCPGLLGGETPPTIPPSLLPTNVQRQIKHPAWIDAIPLPQLRDNFIFALGTFHYQGLCVDLLSGIDEGGVMVWGDPWHYTGWEMSEAFAKKWWPVLKGCEEFYESTNSWRRKRGEKDLSSRLRDMIIA